MTLWQTVTWDTARTAGFVSYGLVTLSVALGLVLSLRWRSPWWPRWATTDLHRYLTLLAIVFTGVHTLAIWLDPFMAFTPAEVLVPLVSHYRPTWVAFGIVSAYLLIAIWLSERAQKRIGYPWWRRLHYLTFGIFVLATVHGIASGSDTRTVWAMGLYAGSGLLVATLLGTRLLMPDPPMKSHPRVATLAAVVAVLLAAWVTTGPLRPGWNLIANNGHGSGARLASASSTGSGTLALPFSAQLSGTAQTSGFRGGDDGGGDGESQQSAIEVSGTLSGGARGTLTMVLNGQPTGDGFVVQRARVVLQPGGHGDQYQGQMVSMEGGTITAQCTDPSGRRVRLDIQVQIDGQGGVSGTVQGSGV